MAGDTISLEDDEMQVLAQLVAEALDRGDSRESVLADLSNNGIPKDEAKGLVNMVEFQLQQAAAPQPSGHSKTGSGGGMGWLIWIAVIVGFKILAALFK